MGVAGAGAGRGPILIAGFAGLLAGSLSMALGEWLSVQSARELYANQLRIETSELEQMPEEEETELQLIYEAKGMTPANAREMARCIVRGDRDSALNTMAREELGINPQELGGSAWVAALTSPLCAAAVGVWRHRGSHHLRPREGPRHRNRLGDLGHRATNGPGNSGQCGCSATDRDKRASRCQAHECPDCEGSGRVPDLGRFGPANLISRFDPQANEELPLGRLCVRSGTGRYCGQRAL